MWYFSWILGIGVALSLGIINVMWLEARHALPAEAPPADAAHAADSAGSLYKGTSPGIPS